MLIISGPRRDARRRFVRRRALRLGKPFSSWAISSIISFGSWRNDMVSDEKDEGGEVGLGRSSPDLFKR